MRLATVLFLLLLFPGLPAIAEEGDEEEKPKGEEGERPGGPGGRRGGPGAGRGGMGRGGSMWDRVRRFDKDGDGKVTAEEFTGPQRFFDRMDTDGDGCITKDEAEAMRGGRGQGGGGRAGGLSPTAIDTDKDGKVSQAEWTAWFEKADKNGDGEVDTHEWAAASTGRALRDPAPKVGDAAPKVEVESLKTRKLVDLSAPKRTTVLIFGSHT